MSGEEVAVSAGETVFSLGLEGELRTVDRPVRLAMIGCGSHTYRNVLPVLRYIPGAELVACCDLNIDKARAYSRCFGASSSYPDYRALVDSVELDGILLVLGFDEVGRPRYPEVVTDLLGRGLPVWLEKPPAATMAEVMTMQAAAVSGAFAQVGFKKMFAPATRHVRAILAGPEFAVIASYCYRYSVDLPEFPGDLQTADGRRFLDDFVHVASVIIDLIGVPSAVTSYRSPDGDGMLVLEHAGGTVGVVHLSSNASGLDSVEDMLIVGLGANVRVTNGVEVEYFPRGWRGPYGRSTTYFPQELDGITPQVTDGPRRWVPEFSLGTLGSGRYFVQGYFDELFHFVQCVREGRQPERASLDDARRVMALVEAVRLPYRVKHKVAGAAPLSTADTGRSPVEQRSPSCGRTAKAFVLKDGWNYSCTECGATATPHEQLSRPCQLQEWSTPGPVLTGSNAGMGARSRS